MNGFSIYGVDPLELRYCYGTHLITLEGDPVGIVEMLYISSTVVVVGAKDKGTFSPKRVTFWNTNEDIVGAELSFMSPIKCIKLNHTRLLIGLEDAVYIHDYDLKEIAKIKFCSASVRCALSPTAENPYLAISSGMLGEEITTYDVIDCKLITSFKAHESPVHSLIFNERGTMLASASTKVRQHLTIGISNSYIWSTERRTTIPTKKRFL